MLRPRARWDSWYRSVILSCAGEWWILKQPGLHGESQSFCVSSNKLKKKKKVFPELLAYLEIEGDQSQAQLLSRCVIGNSCFFSSSYLWIEVIKNSVSIVWGSCVGQGRLCELVLWGAQFLWGSLSRFVLASFRGIRVLCTALRHLGLHSGVLSSRKWVSPSHRHVKKGPLYPFCKGHSRTLSCRVLSLQLPPCLLCTGSKKKKALSVLCKTSVTKALFKQLNCLKAWRDVLHQIII